MRTKSMKVIGTTRDSILAIHVTRNKLREFDMTAEELKREEGKRGGGDEDEERKDPRRDDSFYVCCVDESENVYVFSHKS